MCFLSRIAALLRERYWRKKKTSNQAMQRTAPRSDA
jgi:hypothetical protein